MYKKFLCWMLAFAFVLVSGGDKLILSVGAGLIADGELDNPETITMMQDFADDKVMVVLTHEASLQFIDYTPADFPEFDFAEIQDLSAGKGAKVQAVLRGEQLEMDSIGARFMNQNIDVVCFRRILSLKLANPGKGNVMRAIVALEQRDDVYSAEPDYIYQVDLGVETQSTTSQNAPVFGWGAEKIEQEAAWEIETGSNTVYVGVVDSGIDNTHPELDNKVRRGLSEDFVGDGLEATDDPLGHGTHVAGIIGAKYDNDIINFSGVCQYVRLVSLRVINQNNQVRSSALAGAINHAEANDIPLLNLSLVVNIHDNDRYNGVDETDESLHTAIANYNGLLICAAGNNAIDLKYINSETSQESIPAIWNFDNIISVGASNQTDARWEDINNPSIIASNFDTAAVPGNRKVDIFAPGYNIVSCYPLSDCATSNCDSPGHANYGYHYFSGTSMATPFVTGVAALLFAHYPNATPTAIKNMILNSIDEISALSGICLSGGRLNAYNALSN